jgi:hypothetical protein
MKFNPIPQKIIPFNKSEFADIKKHVTEVRRIYDWPGIDYHDKGQDALNLFNRWSAHNLPLLVKYHNSAKLISLASKLAGRPLKPSYCFLSMYGSDGVCPIHVDRPQCQFTIDLQVNTDGEWPIYIEKKPYKLTNGEALFYSGTGQEHFRKPMKEDGTASFMDLVFFHFVPVEWQGIRS